MAGSWVKPYYRVHLRSCLFQIVLSHSRHHYLKNWGLINRRFASLPIPVNLISIHRVSSQTQSQLTPFFPFPRNHMPIVQMLDKREPGHLCLLDTAKLSSSAVLLWVTLPYQCVRFLVPPHLCQWLVKSFKFYQYSMAIKWHLIV